LLSVFSSDIKLLLVLDTAGRIVKGYYEYPRLVSILADIYKN